MSRMLFKCGTRSAERGVQNDLASLRFAHTDIF